MRWPSAGALAASVLAAALAASVLASALAAAQTPASDPAAAPVLLATTTSVETSGLLDDVLAQFEAARGVKVRVMARGTGNALRIAQLGDADAVLVHHWPSELEFMAQGGGVERRVLMHNRFGLVGPADDPAGVSGSGDGVSALRRIHDAGERGVRFISRSDNSGTHYRERETWAQAGLDPQGARDPWFLEIGAGMGAALNMAAELNAYTLSDRSTWLAFANRRGLRWWPVDDPAWLNCYAIMGVNPERQPHVRAAGAQELASWLASPQGQEAIGAFTLRGEQAFAPGREGCP